MVIHTPARWTTGSSELTEHPYSPVAWLLSDRTSVITEMTRDQQDVIQDIIKVLEETEDGVTLERSQERSKLSTKPLKTNDDELQAAFHVATLNRQMGFDEISYETFKLLYDDITSILRSNKQ